ncbi:hypothetical protein BN2475_950063 [Paraburkholderia ribeironis]|uniref:Uncharacterized protein n=1 Tax=Paraburkholderia ribeironis TaxID=1247936 RepID=A0A1N7SLI3_9BURK|nr:hypothetical protein BN2475_950063 [Paraburkholderia ribeironis]
MAAGPIPATGNFDRAYCKRTTTRKAVNDGNVGDCPQKRAAGTRRRYRRDRKASWSSRACGPL